jgi:hypothetical protein
MQSKDETTKEICYQADFREHLDQLEGNNGLISLAEVALREEGYSLESS